MSDKSSDKGLGVLGLGVASATLLTMGMVHGNPLAVTSGVLSTGATVGLQRKQKVGFSDFKGCLGLIGDGLDESWESLTTSTSSTTEALLTYIPDEYKPRIERIVEAIASDDWFSHMLSQSKMIVGQSGAGKTPTMLYELYTFIKSSNGKGKVTICDVNYGKPTMGKPNNWLGLPRKRFIRNTVDGLYEAIEEYWDELQYRKSYAADLADRGSNVAPGFTPWLLMIDEGNVSLSQLAANKELGDRAMEMIGDLLFEARSYGITITIAVQTPAVEETKINRAKLGQLNFLVLGESAVDPEILGKIPGMGSQKDSLIEQVKELRKRKEGKYSAVVKRCGQSPAFAVKVVPTINTDDLKVSLPANYELPWIERVKDDVGAEIEDLAKKYSAKEIKSPWKKILAIAGLNQNAKSREPEKYQQLRDYWEGLCS